MSSSRINLENVDDTLEICEANNIIFSLHICMSGIKRDPKLSPFLLIDMGNFENISLCVLVSN